MTQEGPFYKVPEVAAMLRTDESTVRRRIRAGELDAVRPFGQYLVSQAAIDRFLARARVRPVPPPSQPHDAVPALPPPPVGRAPGGSFRARRRREAA